VKVVVPVALAALTLSAPAASAQTGLGPDAAFCAAGTKRPALLVKVDGFKNRVGRLRLQLYGSNPDDFLERGKKVRRVDLPVSRAGPMQVCLAVPRPGVYALAVRHDADANGKTGWNDGGGFSNNPKLSLMNLKPNHKLAAFTVGNGVKPLNIILNYRRGLSIAPIGR
jgi:uncharacterized protein (DUF2141 family)